MAISLRAIPTWSFGTNSFAPTIPATQVTGDMMLLIVAGKPFNASWSAPGDWTSLGSGASGSTAAGVDTGSMKIEVFYKVATSDTETNPTVTEGATVWNVAGAVVHVFAKGAAEVWSTPVAVFGADESSGTGISVTFASDPGGIAGDYVSVSCGINSDAMGPLTTDLTPSWTGITFGAADSASEGESTLGGDMAGHAMSRPVSSGTSSAAPTATGTGTASGGADRLEAAFVRLRVTTGTPLVIQDAAHAHTADNLALTQHNVLAVADATHAHTSDNLALTQHNILAVADATHAHTADNLELTYHAPGTPIIVQDALHAHSADNIVLTQHQVLVVQDGGHAHSADNIVLVLGSEEDNTANAHRDRRRRPYHRRRRKRFGH